MASGGSAWWNSGVIYQVYIRSFADGNGDGTGDIAGLRSRLPYLKELGVDGIWINPWYKSPLADGGYDVTDYRQIERVYGDMAGADALIEEAHALGMKVIPDLVPNHTSDQHRWFLDAIASPVGHPSRDRYHILDGRGTDGELPPNDWTSVFGGPAWTRLETDGQWYLHIFDKSQPDLNWANPEVRLEFKEILRYWLDKGVDGFRIDVAHGLCKDMAYPDTGKYTGDLLEDTTSDSVHPFWDRDEVQDIVREWRGVLDEYAHKPMMIAEAWVSPKRVPRYLEGGYHQVFNFKLLQANWDAKSYTDIVSASVKNAQEVGSVPTWVLANHDVMREATRFGLPAGTNFSAWPVTGPADALDTELGKRRARAASMLMLSLPGGAYLYQGQELGLPEVWDLPEDVLDDPVWLRSGKTRKGRDGCRVPIPWTKDGESFGFSEGEGKAWLPQPREYWGQYSVEAQKDDKQSSLAHFKLALKLRRPWVEGGDAKLEMMDLGTGVVAYKRGSGLIVVANMGEEEIDMPKHKDIILRSMPTRTEKTIAVDETVWLA